MSPSAVNAELSASAGQTCGKTCIRHCLEKRDKIVCIDGDIHHTD